MVWSVGVAGGGGGTGTVSKTLLLRWTIVIRTYHIHTKNLPGTLVYITLFFLGMFGPDNHVPLEYHKPGKHNRRRAQEAGKEPQYGINMLRSYSKIPIFVQDDLKKDATTGDHIK